MSDDEGPRSGPIGEQRANAHPDGWHNTRDNSNDGDGKPGPDRDETGYRIGKVGRHRKD